MDKLMGRVINRNYSDMSIELKLNSARLRAVVNLTCWINNQENKNIELLPHRNTTITLHNVQYIRSIKDECDEAKKPSKKPTITEFYVGGAMTIVEHYGKVKNAIDDFVTWMDTVLIQQAQIEPNLNILDIVQRYNLEEKHIEVFIWLPYFLPKLKAWEALRFALFNQLSMDGIMNNMQVKDKKILLHDDKLIIHKLSTIAGIIHPKSEIYSSIIDPKCDVPFFGNAHNKSNEILIGILTSRMGKLELHDNTISIIIHMNCKHNSDALKFCNRLVVIYKYQVAHEIYNDGIAQCLIVDIDNVKILLPDLEELKKDCESSMLFDDDYIKPAIVQAVDEIPGNIDTLTTCSIFIEAIAPLSKVFETETDAMEVWLLAKVMYHGQPRKSFVALSDAYLSTVAFLDVGRAYTIYMPEILTNADNPYVKGYNTSYDSVRIKAPGAYFLPEGDCLPKEFGSGMPTNPTNLNMTATLVNHFLNNNTDKRKVQESSFQIGMLARNMEHRLDLHFADGTRGSMYTNRWQMKQTPEGLIPDVKLQLIHVSFVKGNYLKSNFFTNIKVVGVTDRFMNYQTANLNHLSTAPPHHQSMLAREILDLTNFVYLRTKVCGKVLQAEVNFAHKRFEFAFLGIFPNGGECKLRISNFRLIFKFLKIDDADLIKQIIQECKYDDLIDLTCIDRILKDENCKLDTDFIYWLQIMHKIFNEMTSIDVLCKKMNFGGFDIVDVYEC